MEFDHAVIVVQDLDRAIADYTLLGFTVTSGGDHADGLTHNALIAFADGSYLELLAFRPAAPAADHYWWRARMMGGGLADWAVRTGNLAARAAALRAAGLPLGPSWDGGRARPDGVQLRWKGTRPAPAGGLPFLIEDVTPRDLRVPGGAATVHANRAHGVDAIVIAVADLPRAVERYARLLDVEAPPPALNPLLAAQAVDLLCGTVTVTLAAASTGPLGERVERRGAGPYALVLSARGSRPVWLDERLSHGVPLRLEPAHTAP